MDWNNNTAVVVPTLMKIDVDTNANNNNDCYITKVDVATPVHSVSSITSDSCLTVLLETSAAQVVKLLSEIDTLTNLHASMRVDQTSEIDNILDRALDLIDIATKEELSDCILVNNLLQLHDLCHEVATACHLYGSPLAVNASMLSPSIDCTNQSKLSSSTSKAINTRAEID